MKRNPTNDSNSDPSDADIDDIDLPDEMNYSVENSIANPHLSHYGADYFGNNTSSQNIAVSIKVPGHPKPNQQKT
jgi:hypothetical protein